MHAKTAARFAIVCAFLLGSVALFGWDPLPIASDPKVFMPGSQPGSAALESANRCDNCHGGYNSSVEPAYNWRGSMMSHAARDPLWLATLTVANQDSIWVLGNPNAGDLCIRCHTPTGWLGGRSEPTNTSALIGSDLEGVSCDGCHTLVDPLNGLRQAELPAETSPTGISESNRTYADDLGVLSALTLFDGSPFLNSTTRLPVWYGNGALPNYVEAAGGQYFADPAGPKRGPRFDVEPRHQWNYSRFHKTKFVCATCHDVSNPVLANVLIAPGTSQKQAAGTYFHVERTFSEFSLSAYGVPGGAATNPPAIVSHAASCQDCHMRPVTGYAANKSGILLRTDLALHDMTGGNAWMNGILASLDQTHAGYDAFNYALLSGTRYAGAKIDVLGVQGRANELLAGRSRALDQLARAASLVPVTESSGAVTLRIVNNTGHKLPSGYPEGRRIWLNVKFRDAGNTLIGEINPYEPLVISTGSGGVPSYVAGGQLEDDRGDLIYEAEMSSDLTSDEETFHFVLGTNRHKDNRIPPKGFDIAKAPSRLVQPRWEGADATSYFTAAEYTGGYDEITFSKPAGTQSWTATLYYQSTSKEYIEFLRDEINGTGDTLSSPTPSGEPQAYIAQSDPFFANLRDWGRAIWELWLHNSGAAPIAMTSVSGGVPLNPPLVTTNSASSITQTGATLNGTVNPNGKSTNGWFQWGTTVAYGNTTSSQGLGSGSSNVPLAQAITGLTCNTLYHFRAVAQNSDGTTNGLDQTFTTSPCPTMPPTVTTNAASSITQTGATLNGTVNPNGKSTNGWFQWGTTVAYGNTTSSQGLGSGSSNVSLAQAIAGLTCNTLYHFRAVAQNSDGTTNGLDQTFTTSPCGTFHKGDLNGDARSDLLWRNTTTGENAYWYLTDISPIGGGGIEPLTASTRLVATGDFNGDSMTDLVWRATNGDNFVWTMDGVNHVGTASLNAEANATWDIVGGGDFNGDGKSDLVWRNSSTGQNRIWLLDGVTFSSSVDIPPVADTAWKIAGVGEFNGDGNSDIVFWNSADGSVAIWFMNGTSLSSSGFLGQVTETAWRVSAVGDTNGDGRSDLMWFKATDGSVSVWYVFNLDVLGGGFVGLVPDTAWTLGGPR